MRAPQQPLAGAHQPDTRAHAIDWRGNRARFTATDPFAGDRSVAHNAALIMNTGRIAAQPGWSGMFWHAFRHSRNPMLLIDEERRHVEVNGAYLQLLGYPRQALIGHHVYELMVDGPMATVDEWRAVLRQRQFTGVAELVCADGGRVKVEFAGHPEVVTGRQLVLCVALKTARGSRQLRNGQTHQEPARLSHRELEVIELIAAGLSGPEIANELMVSHNTVRTHVRNAMGKLEVRSRSQLVARSLGEGIFLARQS